MISALEELNRDIWRPFVATYGALDADAFLDLDREDLVHASGAAGEVHGREEYGRQIRDFFAVVAERGERLAIEFRFDERIVPGDRASERGLFRFTVTSADGEERVSYGRFHTFSVKSDGRWRFLTDYDTNEGADAAAFEAAAGMGDGVAPTV